MWWGLSPLLFHAMRHFHPLEVTAHRILWSLLLLLLFCWMTGRLPALRMALASRSTGTGGERWRLMFGAISITCNWLIFVYAVAVGRIVECSLGYFIYPLMMVVASRLFLKERVSGISWCAVCLAAVGVLIKTIAAGVVPLMGLMVATTFVLYTLTGRMRKAGPITGLTAETLFLAPFALCGILIAEAAGLGRMQAGETMDILLVICTGFITVIPLILHITSTRTIGAALTGMLFYLAPSLQLVLGTVLYGEAFHLADAVAFGLIWLAIGLYSFGHFRGLQAR